MSDLEMTKLCAEAMGIEWCAEPKDGTSGLACYLDPSMKSRDMNTRIYDPLQNDAQAMALVKRFRLQIDPHDEHWNVALVGKSAALRENLNRAICECVAKMKL